MASRWQAGRDSGTSKPSPFLLLLHSARCGSAQRSVPISAVGCGVCAADVPAVVKNVFSAGWELQDRAVAAIIK